MVMCFVPDCKHYSEQKKCKFFVFPAKPEEKKIWIQLIRRQDKEPTKYSLVCSCHFKDRDRKNRPTIFEFNLKRKFNFPTPEKKKRSSKVVECLEAAPSTSQVTFQPEDVPSCSKNFPESAGVCVEAENYFLKQDVDQLTGKLENLSIQFSYEHIKHKDNLILMYTGIPSKALFEIIFNTMSAMPLVYHAKWQVKKIPKIDQLLLTLMKLRLNLPHEDLALRFNCSTATVTNVIMTWISALHKVFFQQLMKNIPSRKKNQSCLPAAFSTFENCRIILDCTEVSSATPSIMDNQRLTYSSYKHQNTWKVLVGVAPNGVITFVSQAYPGSLSDKKIVEHSKVLEQMVPGDLILADKGFLIKNLLPPGVHLNIPPFLTTPQFTESQVYETQKIARARIHIERAIRRIKTFHILQRIPQYFIPHISMIFQVCASLTNFQYPLIKEVEEYYS